MKWILEFVLMTIIIFFVWNILKRIFYKSFYSFNQNENRTQKQRENVKQTQKEKKINWDAETIDYEEIEDK